MTTDLTTRVRTDLPASEPPAKSVERDDSVDYGRRGAVSRLDNPFDAFGEDKLGDDLDAMFGGE